MEGRRHGPWQGREPAEGVKGEGGRKNGPGGSLRQPCFSTKRRRRFFIIAFLI